MDILSTIKDVCSAPGRFFDELEEEPISAPYLYITLLGIPAAVLGGIAGFFTQRAFTAFLASVFGGIAPEQNLLLSPAAQIPLLIIQSYVSLHISFWIAVSLMHVFLKIVRGTGTYAQTAQVYAYGSTPSLIIGWIPLVNIAASIWAIVLYFIGTMRLHDVSGGKAALALIVFPIALVLIIMAIIMALAAAFFGALAFM